jgi:hypothetical protein
MWSWFRLENEMLHNTAGYRRVNFVPLHFDANTKDTRSKKKFDRIRVILEVVIFAGVVLTVALCAYLMRT